MTLSASGRSLRFVARTVVMLPILALLGFLIVAPPDGVERARFLQFIGRFHPISVHLPIALLMVVPLIELAGRRARFSFLLPATGFLLGLATCGAIAAAALGWCLARNGAYSGQLVTQHMWGGLLVAGAAWLCWMLHDINVGAGANRMYFAALAVTVALVSFTGYRGGQISQGENHLTEFMPAPFDAWLGVGGPEAPANSPNGGLNTLYGSRIQPVFVQHCTSCHGRNKRKSNLRLDSYEAAMRGGKHGAVVKPGDVKGSELFRRITLAPSNDDFMPPDNKPHLADSEVKLIEAWISSGASGALPADAVKDIPSDSRTPAVVEITFAEMDPVAVAKQRAGIAPTVEQLRQRFPNLLDYESRASTGIALNASWMMGKFGDSELAALAPVSDYIVTADLSNTAITDKSASAIAGMKHVRTLRLMHTKIGDTTIQSLGGLEQLELLSIFDTPVTGAALPALSRLPKLRHIYANNTKISAMAPVPPEIKDKLVF